MRFQGRRRAAGLVALGLLFLGADLVAAGEPTRVPGTGVRLVPPEGFTPAQRFAGFQSGDGAATILVSEIPGPYAEVKKATEADALAARGMKRVSAEDVAANGTPAILVRIEQTQQATTYAKWMLVGGDAHRSVLLVGTWPGVDSARHEAPIRAALLSATWSKEAARDPFEGLPFRLAPAGTLKLAGRMANLIALNESGTLPAASPSKALLVAGVSFAAIAPSDLATFSETRARATESLSGLTDLVGRPTKVAGLDAYELVASAKDKATGRASLLFQVLVLDGAGYWIVQGIAPSSRAEAMLSEFRAVVASMRRVPAVGSPTAPPPPRDPPRER